jgi:hypothetical protein
MTLYFSHDQGMEYGSQGETEGSFQDNSNASPLHGTIQILIFLFLFASTSWDPRWLEPPHLLALWSERVKPRSHPFPSSYPFFLPALPENIDN